MILKKSSLDSSLNLEMVVCAIVFVERWWQKLRASGNGRLRGGIVCVVDCAGLDITALPISLVAATLRLLDANYPELAAEVRNLGMVGREKSSESVTRWRFDFIESSRAHLQIRRQRNGEVTGSFR